MTREDWESSLRKIHTDAAAQRMIHPLWEDFTLCRISGAEYDLRRRELEECIKRCRKEERDAARLQMKLDRLAETGFRRAFSE